MSAVAVAIIGGGATIGSALIGASAASDAANAQIQASQNASATTMAMFNQTQANEKPYMQAGTNSLAALMQGLGLAPGSNGAVGQGALTKPFNYTASPGYGYEVGQMQQAVQNSAAARGGLNSGNTLLALQQNAQGLASQDYFGMANLDMNQKNQLYQMLQTVAGSGQNAASNLGALGANAATQVGNNTINAGNASAAGTVAGANSVTNLLNNQSFLNGVGGMFGVGTAQAAGGGGAYNAGVGGMDYVTPYASAAFG